MTACQTFKEELNMTTTVLTEGIKTAFTTAVAQIATDTGTMVSEALPYGLAIAGTFIVIRLGIGFFKSIAH